MDYPEEDNCCLVSVEKNGAMTLREVAQRLGVTYARIKQIEKGALKKLELQVQRGKL